MYRNVVCAVAGITLLLVAACDSSPFHAENAETPVISSQPQNAVYGVGAPAAPLTVAASVSDGGTLSYRWYSSTKDSNENGTPIDDAEEAHYTPPTTAFGVVYYYVVVTNTLNGRTAGVTSNTAKVEVNNKVNAAVPNITGQPQNAVYSIGAPATALTVSASVSDGGTLSYQWYSSTEDSNENGTAIDDAEGVHYTPSTDELGIRYYYVVVTNAISNNNDGGNKTASVASDTAKVEVNNKINAAIPVITVQPEGTTYSFGAAAAALTVSASASDGGTLSYRWYSSTDNSNEGGTVIPDAAEARYTPPTATAGTVYYYVIITNTIKNNGDGGNKAAPVASDTAKITVDAPPVYTIVIDIIDNETGDTVTASPDTGKAGDTVTLTYTVANTKHYNLLDFGGVTVPIASVDSAGNGARTYTVNAADASNGVITITATFTHTNLTPDPIAFTDTEGHIIKTYGDTAFTNAVASGYKGSGAITYSSSDINVATVNGEGQVTMLKAGSAIITAEKAADTEYAHARTEYTLAVNRKPVTITGLSVANKVYDGATTATVSGTAVISGKFSGDTVTVNAGTASFVDATAGNGKTVTFSGWSLGGADKDNYNLSVQPASVTANITKAPGAAVNQPTVSGSPTYNSITVNAVSLQTATGQSIEYAISTASNETGLSAWQNETTFTGLNAATTYYVYARSVSTTNYEAGTANVSAGIATAVAVTVTFNSNGGSSVSTQTITDGTMASRPTNPTRSSYTFDYWYQDTGLTIPYYFNTPVTTNITLYAKWVADTDISTMSGKNMVWVAGGTFTMGQTDVLYATPEHSVTLSGFYMGKYQVTQEQYQAVMGSNPSNFTSAVSGESGTPGKLPVERVRWYDAIVFCNKLSTMEGLTPAYSISGSTDPAVWIAGNGGSVPTSSNATWNAVKIVAGSTGYRLPTEAQWEYACRAGTTTVYNTGDTISDNTGWYNRNSGNTTHEVGLKPANAWGLYDIHGNVYEWCWDWMGSYTSGAQTNPTTDASSGTNRVMRGGSCNASVLYVRSANRSWLTPYNGGSDVGFRLVRP